MALKRVLLVLIPDRMSEIVEKGEYTQGYYNPGDLFDTVHIVMTNDDWVDPSDVQRTVGRAKLFLHNIPEPPFKSTLGWRPRLLRHWVEHAVALARRVRPDLVRAHQNVFNGYLGAQIRERLGVPFVVSLHINPDEDVRGRLDGASLGDRLRWRRRRMFESASLRAADCVLAVYEPIRDYALAHGARRFEVAYNVLSRSLRAKESYALRSPPRVICVGNQFRWKNPENVVRAVAETTADLTLVGRGEYHDRLRSVALESGLEGRITFLPSVPNDELCRMLAEHDVFAAHSEFWELSKTVMEAMLTGLPVVMNRRIGRPVPELREDRAWLVENTVAGYREALTALLEDAARRESMGRRAREYAARTFAPEETERRVIDLYRELVPGL